MAPNNHKDPQRDHGRAVQDAVEEGRLTEALEHLERWVEQGRKPARLIDELHTCRMRVFTLEKSMRRGEVAQDDYRAELVRIAQQILKLNRLFRKTEPPSPPSGHARRQAAPEPEVNARTLVDAMEIELSPGRVRGSSVKALWGSALTRLTEQAARVRLASTTTFLFSVHQAKSGGIRSGITHWSDRDEPGEWTTAEAIYVSLRSHLETRQGPDLDAIGNAVDWLTGGRGKARLSSDGGWGDIGFETRPPHRPKFPSCTESTAWAVLALSECLIARRTLQIRLNAPNVTRKLNAGVSWLQEQQRSDGGWGSFKNDDLGSRTYPTAMALIGLARAVSQSISDARRGLIHKLILGGVSWLSRNHRDGGWGANIHESHPNAASTAHVFYALNKLIRAGISDGHSSAVALARKEAKFIKRVSRSPQMLKNHVEAMPWNYFGAVLQLEWVWLPWIFPPILRSGDTSLVDFASAELHSNYLERLDNHRSWTICLAAFALSAYLEGIRASSDPAVADPGPVVA